MMYSLRASLDSLWKVGKKRSWWNGIRGGDVLLFVTSLALMNVVHERRRDAVDRGIGKALGWMKGEELLGGKLQDRKDEKSE